MQNPARVAQRWSFAFPTILWRCRSLGLRDRGTSRPAPRQRTVGHAGVDAMMGDLSILAVGLVIGVAIAWVLPGLPQRPHSVGARAAPRAEKPAGKRDSGARPKNDQLSLRQDVRGCAPPVGNHPFARFSQNSFWGGIARISWIDFFESKCF